MHFFLFRGHFAIVYISWELGYDAVVFFLTIARTVYVYWKQQGFAKDASGKSSLIENLLRDGSFYFGCVSLFLTHPMLICIRCIFSVNLMWVYMTLHAPTGFRAIASMYG